jgi:DNA polymerase III epsilon subunit-like protein
MVLDFEATAFPGPGSVPIEVGIASVSTGATMSWLIRPAPEWRERIVWDPASAAVHGIRREDLATGRPVSEVADALARAVAGHVVVSDAGIGSGG